MVKCPIIYIYKFLNLSYNLQVKMSSSPAPGTPTHEPPYGWPGTPETPGTPKTPETPGMNPDELNAQQTPVPLQIDPENTTPLQYYQGLSSPEGDPPNSPPSEEEFLAEQQEQAHANAQAQQQAQQQAQGGRSLLDIFNSM